MFPKKQPAVLYLLRSGFFLYIAGSPQVISASFPLDSINDLEVLSSEKLLVMLNTFFSTNKLVPVSVLVVLAPDVIFEKEILSSQNPQPDTKQIDNKKTKELEIAKHSQEEATLNEYLDYVPFDDKLFKSFKGEHGIRVAVTNKTIIDVLSQGLLKFQSDISGVVPYFVYGGADIFSSGLTDQLAHTILQRADILKQNNMLLVYKPQSVQQDGKGQPVKSQEPVNNKRLFMLIGVFGLLLIIMVVVYFLSQQPVKQPANIVNNIPPLPTETQPVASSSPQLDTTISTESARSLLTAVTVKIVHPSSKSSLANTLRTQLTSLGFTLIQTEISDSNTSPRTTVLFPSSFNNEIRNIILSEVNKNFSDVLSQESAGSTSDVTIIVGNN